MLSRAWEKSSRYRWGCILLLIAVCFGVYANSLSGSFVATDRVRWEESGWAKGRSIPEMARALFIPGGGTFYRPIPYMLYVVDYHIWGPTPMGFHITNTVLHALASILVFFAAAAILRHGLAPLIVALLFATHPVHTEAVTYVAGRTEVTMGIFFLLSFLLYVRFRTHSGKTGPLLYAGSVMAFVLALLCKEAAVALPLVLVLYEVYFRSGNKDQNLWKRLMPVVPLLAVVGLFYLGVTSITGAGRGLTVDRMGLGLQGLTAVRTLHRYFRLLLFPVSLSFAHDFTWSSSFSEPHALPALVTVILILLIILAIYRASKVLSFGLAWVVVTILPISNLLALTRFEDPLMSERYLYVPSIGFCVAIGYVVSAALCRLLTIPGGGLHRKIGLALLTVLLVAYASLTVRRNQDWHSQHSLATKTLEQNPKAVEAHLVLGENYLDKGQHEEAIEEFRQALLRYPSNARARLGLGFAYGENGEYGRAISEINQAIMLNPEFTDAYHTLGAIYCRMGRIDAGIDQYHKALALDPNSARVRNSLGNAQLMKGNADSAIYEYKMALKMNPGLVETYANLASAYARTGKTEEAMAECRKALAIDPESGDIHSCIGGIYLVMGNVNEAFSALQRAIAINPNLAGAHVNLALIHSRKGDYDLAIAHCDRAIELGAAVNPEFLESLRPYR